MCSIGLAVGGLQAVGGVMQAQAAHNAQAAQVARQNQIAQQQYDDQLRQQAEKDRIKKNKHAADLAAHAQATNDFRKQMELNQLEANRAISTASAKKKEREAKAAFDLEAAVSAAVEAQGAMLSTGNAGQSFLLQTEQNQRELGFATAQLEQTLMDSDDVYSLEIDGIAMSQYGKDASAYSNLPGMPAAPRASFLPYKPIKAKGPSKMGLMGAMIGAVGGGIAGGLKAEANWEAFNG